MDVQEKRQKLLAQVEIVNDRAQLYNLPATVTEGQFIAALSYWAWQCAVCKASAKPLALEHWLPLSDPRCPGSVIENLIPLCHDCQTSKKNRHGAVWLAHKLYGSALAEVRTRLEAYRSTIGSLPTVDLSIPDTYSPEAVAVRQKQTPIAKMLLRLYLEDPDQCRLWEYYQALAHRNKGTEWIVRTLIKALPPDSNG